MIALNTDVLLRYVLQDHPKHSARASGMICSLGDKGGYISTSVLLDLHRRLTEEYSLRHESSVQGIDVLVRCREIVVQDAEVVHRAIRRYKKTERPFTDCLAVEQAINAGCTQMVSFQDVNDRVGMTVLI